MNERQATIGIDDQVVMTVSGKLVHFLDPQPEEIDIHDIAHALANQCRFGGHTRYFYSVAQHCIFVSRKVSPEFAREALLHDAAEAYLVDLPRPLKLELGNYNLIEEILRRAIFARFGLPRSELHGMVKRHDLVASITEGRDIGPRRWNELLDFGVDPWSQRVFPLPRFVVKWWFLRRFKRLFPEYA
jgi:hypothetical protein